MITATAMKGLKQIIATFIIDRTCWKNYREGFMERAT